MVSMMVQPHAAEARDEDLSTLPWESLSSDYKKHLADAFLIGNTIAD